MSMFVAHSSRLLRRQVRQFAVVRNLSDVPSSPDNVITKADMVKEVAEAHDLTLAKSERIVSNVFDTVMEGIADDRDVRISGFGIFQGYESKATTGRNPRTGESIVIPSKKRIRFKAYTAFKRTVRGES